MHCIKGGKKLVKKFVDEIIIGELFRTHPPNKSPDSLCLYVPRLLGFNLGYRKTSVVTSQNCVLLLWAIVNNPNIHTWCCMWLGCEENKLLKSVQITLCKRQLWIDSGW